MHCNISRFVQFAILILTGICLNSRAQIPDTAKAQPKTTRPTESTAEFGPSPDANKMLLDSLKKHRDSTQVMFFYSDFEKLGPLDVHQNDTALTGFQTYDLLYKHDRFYATLGNIGGAYRSMMPFQTVRESGFDYGIHSLDRYLYQNDSVRYYKVVKTYTELTYVQGAKKEQNFHAIFSRNIYRSFNLGFDFHVMSAPGAYYRQKTNGTASSPISQPTACGTMKTGGSNMTACLRITLKPTGWSSRLI